MACAGKSHPPTEGQKLRELLIDEAKEWIGLSTRQQENRNRDFLDRPRFDFWKQCTRGHHYVPLMRIAQRLVAGCLRHLGPGVRIVKDVAHEGTDSGVPV